MKNAKVSLAVKLTISALVIAIISVCFVSQYDMATFWSRKTKTVILDGMSLTHTETLSSSGWLNINTISADLTKKNLSAGVITGSDSVGKVKTVPTFLSSGKAIAATNASFFAYSDVDNKYTACGIVVKNNEIISCRPVSESYFKQFAHVVISKDNTVSLQYFTPYLYIMNEKGSKYKINRYNNAYTGTESITIQDSKYTTRSPGNSKFKGVTELVVENGKMKSLRENQAPVTITKNMFVLTSKGTGANTLKKIFVKGESLTFHSLTAPPVVSPVPSPVASNPTVSPKTTPNPAGAVSAATVTPKPGSSSNPPATPLPGKQFTDFKAVIPGGGMLVNNGKALTKFSHVPIGSSASSLNPRTALGISQDGKKIFMVTVDGRQNESKGISMTDLATMMVNMGAYYAINFDGGSSTAMAYKNPRDRKNLLANMPLGTPTVINAFGIFASADKTLDTIDFSSGRNIFLRNVPFKMSVKGWNSAFENINIDYTKVKWSVTGVKGTFKGNVFKPTTAGSGRIKASYLGKSVTRDIRVTAAPVSLAFSKDHIQADPKSSYGIKVTAKNRNGFYSYVDASSLTWGKKGNIGDITKSGQFTASSKALSKGYISASLGRLKCYLPVVIKGKSIPSIKSVKLPKSSTYKNIWNKKPAANGSKIFVTYNTLSGFTAAQNNLLSAFVTHANNKSNLLATIGSAPYIFETGYNNQLIKVNGGYRQYLLDSVLSMSLDTSKKGLFSYNPNQWSFLTSRLVQNKTKILMMRSLTGNWTNKKEAAAFKSQLSNSSLKTGKLTWVVHPGAKASHNIVNGVLYITVPPLISKNTCNYLEISTKNGVATFQFKAFSGSR